MKAKKRVLIGVLLISLLVSFSFQSRFFEIAKQLEIYTTLFKELNMYYVNEINPAELTNKAIKNTLKNLDPYTNYFDEQAVEDAKIRREGEYGGIGASVLYNKGSITLTEIFKDYAADKVGLKAGDVVTVINGQSLKDLDRASTSDLLKGIPGSDISLEVLRQGEKLNFNLKREKIIVNPVPFYEMVTEDVGYIVLTQFNEKASAEVKKAYIALKEKGMQKLIFDLRGNLGGSLFESINISNFFLPKGSAIVSTKAKVKRWSTTYRANNKALDLQIPIVVLINGRSASASEIVSGALQDYDRAVILGQRSFGKGLVQRYRKLTYGSQLKVTISKYYTPSGRCIQELDYANRDLKTGKVPKFSDGGVNKFTTKNGRIVYDGGGILPDVEIKKPKQTDATEKLLRSQALFNYVTYFVAANKETKINDNFIFSDRDFKLFENYLIKQDTTFKSKQEQQFSLAYKTIDNTRAIQKEYKAIQEELKKEKIASIEKNKEELKSLLQDEIIERFLYKIGVYKSHLKSDKEVLKAVELLQNNSAYSKILTN